jgi:hypothetical protein
MMLRVWHEEGWTVHKHVVEHPERWAALIDWETHTVNLYPHDRRNLPVGRTIGHELFHINFGFDNEDLANHDEDMEYMERYFWRGLDAPHRLALEALAD